MRILGLSGPVLDNIYFGNRQGIPADIDFNQDRRVGAGIIVLCQFFAVAYSVTRGRLVQRQNLWLSIAAEYHIYLSHPYSESERPKFNHDVVGQRRIHYMPVAG